MKRKFSVLLASVIILSFLNSCRTRQTPSPIKNEASPQIQRTEQIYNAQEPKYSIPEDASTEQTLPVQPAPPASSPPKTQKKSSEPKPIGSYQTPLLNRDKERMENIGLAIKKINGYKLKPGDTFSFNDVVGKRDASNGFKVAAIIVNGEYGEDMGGGVCQLSSTIFNAAERAGMEILERHSHSRSVRYVPQGKDAAVSYGYLDLKFKNSKKYTVELKAKVEDKKLKVYIYKAR
ncbi:VanW family protein [Clostridium swellfunianum]|uniref:VanW family protein n=1 Tax=Clostridium swellfunianum TaxID=1367462 RepID=UPI00202FFA60|nr:VanW family protein [Clostridium swellfunianum]MCM0649084.1 VanW family protein [Clostridium swellfunianum]